MALQKGLVGHWSMNSEDTDNGKIRDRSAYDNHGTLQNGPTTGNPSPVGDSYGFDGNDDRVKIDNVPTNSTSEVTVSAWVYITGNAGNSWERHVDLQNGSGGQIVVLRWDDDGAQYGFQALGADADVNEDPPQNVWLHWVGVVRNGTAYFYEDTVQKATGSTGGSSTASSSVLGIGNRYDGNDHVLANMSDVRIYNRALSQSEINQLYNQRSNRTQKTKNFVKAELYEPGGRASDKESLDSYYTDSNFVKARVHNRPHIYFGNSNQNAGFGSVNGYPSYFDGINKDNYSWRMRINFIAPESGTYEFGVDSDDASDLLIDGNAVATFYDGHAFDGDLRNHTGTIDLNQGNSYQLQARFQEGGGGDGIAVGWKKPSDSSWEKFPLKITNQSQIDI